MLTTQDTVLFDRNDELDHTTNETILHLHKVREFMFSSLSNEKNSSVEILEAKKRLFNKFFDVIELQNNGYQPDSKFITENPDYIDNDMFVCGELIDQSLNICICPFKISIDLKQAIGIAMRDDKHQLLSIMMDHQLDISKYEPQIMIMCVQKIQWNLMNKFIDKKFDISVNNYQCVYQLAAFGQLNLLIDILNNYQFKSIEEIIGKICVQAIVHNHVNIIDYFFTKEAFDGAPDKMRTYFLHSITYGGHLDIIKFFVRRGISIKQNNYEAFMQSINHKKYHLVKYFCTIEPSCIDLLEPSTSNTSINQYIGLLRSCNISYDDILINDKYYQCRNKLHYYKEHAWKMNHQLDTVNVQQCPICFSLMDNCLYVNDK